MNEFLKTPAFWPVLYLILVLGRVPIKEILKVIGNIAESIRGDSGKVSNAAHAGNDRVFRALKQMFDVVLEVLTLAIDSLDRGIQSVARQFTKERENLPSRILGAIFGLALLLCFIYADAALAFQTAQTLFEGIVVPTFFRNIAIPLVASSVATVAALGLMFWDVMGYTEFTPLARMQGLLKGVFLGAVALTGILTIGCTLMMALNRATLIAGFVDQAGFSPLVVAEIHRWASVAQSVVIVPLLLTTFMMFHGIFGLFVLYMLAVGAVSFVFKITRLLVRVLKVVVVPGVSDAIASGFLYAVVELTLVGLGWIIGATLACAAALTQVLQHLLDVITLPSIKIWDFIIPIIRSLIARNTRPSGASGQPSDEPNADGPKKPSDQPIPEVLERLRSNGNRQHFTG